MYKKYIMENKNKTFIEIANELNSFLEPMYEMSMAWRSIQKNRCVWVENPTDYNNKYFKYLNGPSYNKAEKVARISLLKPQYLQHNNTDGKKDWILTNKEKKELIQLMNQPNKKYANCTNWQATIITYNEDNFEIDFDEIIADSYNKKKFPNAIPIDYPMPDYMQL